MVANQRTVEADHRETNWGGAPSALNVDMESMLQGSDGPK